MPYPAKTSPEAIRRAALALLEREGEAGLTIRGVAAALGLAPNALYRHYAGHDALRAAVADDGTRALLDALRRAAVGRSGFESGPAAVVRAVAHAYLDFAHARPALYGLVMARHDHPVRVPATRSATSRTTDDVTGEVTGDVTDDVAHDALWAFVVALLGPLTGPANVAAAAVALWGFLHGMVGLDRAELLGGAKPRDAAAFGVEVFLGGLAQRKGGPSDPPS